MDHRTDSFKALDGTTLFRQRWLPGQGAKAVVALVHGFGEHCGRYGNVVQALVPRGFIVAGYDLRGHGRSEGVRGAIRAWKDYREDTGFFIGQLEAEHSGLPLFLYGHSMGGLIALEYALHHPDGLHGVIASAPTLGQPGISPLLLLLSRLLSAVWPALNMATKLDSSAISRDPAVVEAYQSDPLVHDLGTPRLGTEMMKAAEWAQSQAPNFKVPLLMLQGEQDRLVPPADTRRFFEHAGVQDKTYLTYPAGFHEPHNDVEHERVMADVARWLEDHLS